MVISFTKINQILKMAFNGPNIFLGDIYKATSLRDILYCIQGIKGQARHLKS